MMTGKNRSRRTRFDSRLLAAVVLFLVLLVAFWPAAVVYAWLRWQKEG